MSTKSENSSNLSREFRRKRSQRVGSSKGKSNNSKKVQEVLYNANNQQLLAHDFYPSQSLNNNDAENKTHKTIESSTAA